MLHCLQNVDLYLSEISSYDLKHSQREYTIKMRIPFVDNIVIAGKCVTLSPRVFYMQFSIQGGCYSVKLGRCAETIVWNTKIDQNNCTRAVLISSNTFKSYQQWDCYSTPDSFTF